MTETASTTCPYCNVSIPADATECSQCNSVLSATDDAIEDLPLPVPQRGYAFGTLFRTGYYLAFFGAFSCLLLISFFTILPREIKSLFSKELNNLIYLYFLPRILGFLLPVVLFFQLAIVAIAWQTIQPLRYRDRSEQRMPTAVGAVGFLFVPLFNFYWFFVAYFGLSKRMNKLSHSHGTSDVISSYNGVLRICILLFVFTAFSFLLFFLGPITRTIPSGFASVIFGACFSIFLVASLLFHWMHFQLIEASNQLCIMQSRLKGEQATTRDRNTKNVSLIVFPIALLLFVLFVLVCVALIFVA